MTTHTISQTQCDAIRHGVIAFGRNKELFANTHETVMKDGRWDAQTMLPLNELTPDELRDCLKNGYHVQSAPTSSPFLARKADGASLTPKQLDAIDTWIAQRSSNKAHLVAAHDQIVSGYAVDTNEHRTLKTIRPDDFGLALYYGYRLI